MAKLKKLCAIVLVIVLAFSVTPDSVFAAKKAKISKTKATIYVGKTIKLKVKNNKKKVKWSTSNKKVAKVNKKGKVKGIKAGKATIIAKVGKKAYKCKIKVKKKRNKKSNIKKPVIKPAESETTVEPTTKTEETTTPEVTTKPEQPTIDESKLNEKIKALKDIIENIKSSV
ncbi:Ig-like domain-containing protein [Eubacterium sp.]|uniref:Ig-like domain-containing protein n=1 Tax=Eubacterium sp. TaxID=142586 RepID=UPI0039996F49